ncbi:MAG: hypothetical protein EVA65_10130 [Oceanococcus sp.]|nr:MAG: hypothetical protein EVA65_10130 [Oceanococcus sp.]
MSNAEQQALEKRYCKDIMYSVPLEKIRATWHIVGSNLGKDGSAHYPPLIATKYSDNHVCYSLVVWVDNLSNVRLDSVAWEGNNQTDVYRKHDALEEDLIKRAKSISSTGRAYRLGGACFYNNDNLPTDFDTFRVDEERLGVSRRSSISSTTGSGLTLRSSSSSSSSSRESSGSSNGYKTRSSSKSKSSPPTPTREEIERQKEQERVRTAAAALSSAGNAMEAVIDLGVSLGLYYMTPVQEKYEGQEGAGLFIGLPASCKWGRAADIAYTKDEGHCTQLVLGYGGTMSSKSNPAHGLEGDELLVENNSAFLGISRGPTRSDGSGLAYTLAVAWKQVDVTNSSGRSFEDDEFSFMYGFTIDWGAPQIYLMHDTGRYQQFIAGFSLSLM